jgi:hypothetical protein
MVEHRLTAWLRPLLTLLAVAGVLSLAACGGGSGSPASINQPGPTPPVITVQPSGITIFPGAPATLTITSGTAPFNVFSDTPSILPIAQSVTGNTIVLLANQVAADTTVNLTVTDASGQNTRVPVSVKPAPLFNTLTFTPSGNDCGADLCSAQTGTARVTALAPGGAPLVGRQIRFDVVYGPIGFVTGNPAQPQAQTLTSTTDNAGVAQVVVQALPNSTTQPAQLRATDVTTGNSQISNFTVVNNTNATQSPMVVVPSNANIQGPDTKTCSTGFRIDYYIYGGTPPYTVQSTFPQAITLLNNTVPQSGGYFSAVTNGACVNPLVFTISDAAGKQTTASLTNVVGTIAPTAPPAPAALNIAPGTLTVAGCAGKTFTFVVTGGTGPYNVTTNPTTMVAPGGNNNTFGVTVPPTVAPAAPFTGTISVTALDSSTNAQTATATITCT